MFDIFVAFPLSHPNQNIVDWRLTQAKRYILSLYDQGIYAYSPVIAMESIATEYHLPFDYMSWQGYCRKTLSMSKGIHVLKFPLWEQSVGLRDEINTAICLQKKISFIDYERR